MYATRIKNEIVNKVKDNPKRFLKGKVIREISINPAALKRVKFILLIGICSQPPSP
jgi:hypothetical protein